MNVKFAQRRIPQVGVAECVGNFPVRAPNAASTKKRCRQVLHHLKLDPVLYIEHREQMLSELCSSE